ncbi:MAG TPA: hypothetical protein VEG38_05355 [Acidimicrobiia bacterium]|nr:hypothetical protein [Acidimicrobiia bacterium]
MRRSGRAPGPQPERALPYLAVVLGGIVLTAAVLRGNRFARPSAILLGAR